MTSSMLVRMNRENLAMVGRARAIVGNTVCAKVVYRATGKIGNTMANTYCSSDATTKLGMEMPMIAMMIDR